MELWHFPTIRIPNCQPCSSHYYISFDNHTDRSSFDGCCNHYVRAAICVMVRTICNHIAPSHLLDSRSNLDFEDADRCSHCRRHQQIHLHRLRTRQRSGRSTSLTDPGLNSIMSQITEMRCSQSGGSVAPRRWLGDEENVLGSGNGDTDGNRNWLI